MVRVPRLRRGSASTGVIAALAASLALAGCPKNVKQDAKTGEDGKSDGAVEVTFANNEAIAKGIVTYPGGDRVDWKTFELPKDQVGKLTVKLRWVPPRPGLDLSVAVLNQWNHVVAETKPLAKRSRRKVKSLTIENAKGKYFLQVYAQKRSDAGKYTVTMTFESNAPVDTFDWLKEPIADPPKLAAVPPTCGPASPRARASTRRAWSGARTARRATSSTRAAAMTSWAGARCRAARRASTTTSPAGSCRASTPPSTAPTATSRATSSGIL